MRRRQLCKTVEQDRRSLLMVNRYLGVVLLDSCYRFLVQFFGRSALQRRKRLVAGDRQQQGGNLGSTLESSGLAPNVQEHFADEILSSRLIPDKAGEKPEDPHVVAGKQNLHRMLVARGNRSNQRYVTRVRGPPAGASNGVELARGAAGGHGVLPLGSVYPGHPTSLPYRSDVIRHRFCIVCIACTGDGSITLGRRDTPDVTPKRDDGLPQEARSKPEARAMLG